MNLKEFIELDKKYKFIEHYVSFLESWEKRKRKNQETNMILDHKYIKNNIHDYLNLVNNFFSLNFKEHMQTAIAELDIKNFKGIIIKVLEFQKTKLNFQKKSIHLFLKIAKKGIWQF